MDRGMPGLTDRKAAGSGGAGAQFAVHRGARDAKGAGRGGHVALGAGEGADEDGPFGILEPVGNGLAEDIGEGTRRESPA